MNELEALRQLRDDLIRGLDLIGPYPDDLVGDKVCDWAIEMRVKLGLPPVE